MSDGERAVLYLAAQVLCVPENKTMIIDEPEVHLHCSIMNRLWKTLENYRTDCLFIYITHDLQFAAMHSIVDKIWIKDFDGASWSLEKIEGSELPEDLSFKILGSRKNVLFVEGEKNSYDYQLYTELYPDYLIIPCGGCSQVISRTRAFKTAKQFTVISVEDAVKKMNPEEGIAERLKNAREEKGWSQRELSERFGVDRTVINRIESGAKLTEKQAVKLAEVLEVGIEWLLKGDEEKKDYPVDQRMIYWC